MSSDTNAHTTNTVTHTLVHNQPAPEIEPSQALIDHLIVRDRITFTHGHDPETVWSLDGMGLTARSHHKGSEAGSIVFQVNNQGLLWARQKSFAIPHPNNPDETLVYGCVEAPEQTITFFGTAVLSYQQPSVTIELPVEWPGLLKEPLGYHVTFSADNFAHIRTSKKSTTSFELEALKSDLVSDEGYYQSTNVDYIVIGYRKSLPGE